MVTNYYLLCSLLIVINYYLSYNVTIHNIIIIFDGQNEDFPFYV